MSEKCNHEKVYANVIYTSNPPQYHWICKLCGDTGVDYGEYRGNEYEEIVNKFKNNK